MPERISKTQRWLDLIAYLAGRRLPVVVDEIMEHVPAYAAKWGTGEATAKATARRTFERDKDELRAVGIPIETVAFSMGPEMGEGYRLTRRDFYLPYLRLVSGSSPSAARPYSTDPARVPEVEIAPEEARIARDALLRIASMPASPFVAEARSALRKLAFDLDLRALSEAPVLALDRPGAAEVVERLRLLSDALLARKAVGFTYRGMYRGETTRREVLPYGLFFSRDWYLVGHDQLRDAVRVFRVARMEALERNPSALKRPDYEVPSDFRLEDYLSRSAWELGGEEEALAVEVLFRFPLSLWAERNCHGELVEERPHGASVRRFAVHQTNPFVRWLLALAGEAEILSPRELADELAAVASRITALYASESDA